jgi:hypothetical protein
MTLISLKYEKDSFPSINIKLVTHSKGYIYFIKYLFICKHIIYNIINHLNAEIVPIMEIDRLPQFKELK